MNEIDFGKSKLIKSNNSTDMIKDSSFELYRQIFVLIEH